MKNISIKDWCNWQIDFEKTVRAYDDKLNWTGWLYYDSELIHLNKD